MVVHHIFPWLITRLGMMESQRLASICHEPCLVDSGGGTSSPSSASVLLVVSTRLNG